MNLETLLADLHISEHMLAMAIGVPRLLVIMQVAPFLGGNLVTGQLRMTIALASYMVLHPLVYSQLPMVASSQLLTVGLYVAIILKEVLLGLMLSYIAGILFWAFQSAGFFIDNQRGASMAEGSDPLSGEQTSPFGSLLFQGLTFVFFASGMFTAFLGIVYASYVTWPPYELLPASVFTDIRLPLFFIEQVCELMRLMLLLAGPILVACLLVDLSLGLINRFASQLNVYVLAMPIKSGVASFLLVFYFGMLMQDALPMLQNFNTVLIQLQRILP